MEPTPKLELSVQRCVDNYLDRIDAVLIGNGLGRTDRQGVLDNVETQIREMLASRARGEPTLEDIRCILAEMDPPESYASDEDAQRSSHVGPFSRPISTAATKAAGDSKAGSARGPRFVPPALWVSIVVLAILATRNLGLSLVAPSAGERMGIFLASLLQAVCIVGLISGKKWAFYLVGALGCIGGVVALFIGRFVALGLNAVIVLSLFLGRRYILPEHQTPSQD
jgi:hypothetical protein